LELTDIARELEGSTARFRLQRDEQAGVSSPSGGAVAFPEADVAIKRSMKAA
jgi:hypothetical protein